MSAIARKINIGVATCAMAAAATLTPVTVAHAVPATAPIGVVGTTAGSLDSTDCTTVSGAPCASSFAGASALPGPSGIVRSIFQNELWWIGGAAPGSELRSEILVFTPLSLVPGFAKPLYGWFTKNLDFQACLLGGTFTVGAYGRTSLSIGRGCN